MAYQSDWDKLFKKLDLLEKKTPHVGAQIVYDAAVTGDREIRDHLAGQGRGGEPPPLSSMTQRIYSIDGDPDGSGITNHLVVEFRRDKNGSMALVGIPEGQPSLVARVQDRGATIPVTDAMRGFLSARYGIHLRAETTHITVPGRHFWRKSISKAKAQAIKDLSQFFSRTV